MFEYSIVQWLGFFYFYCFFGWCFESTFVSVNEKKLTNRGFMKGPLLPLYGSGAVVLLVVSAPFSENLLLTFLAGCVGATMLEYVTAVVMESLFKVRYWDYSHLKLQFQGRISLISSLTWGGLTLLMTMFVHKWVASLFSLISDTVLETAVIIISVIALVDFTIAFKNAMDLRDILVKLEKLKLEIGRMQKRLDVVIAVTAEDFANRREELLEGISLMLDDKKNGMVSAKDNAVEKLKAAIRETENKASVVAEYAKKPLARVLRANPRMKSYYFKFWDEWRKKK